MADETAILMDDTNHDLVHALSVRLDAHWHDRSYHSEVSCDGCEHVFEQLRELDAQAVRLLTRELGMHVQAQKFPVVLSP